MAKRIKKVKILECAYITKVFEKAINKHLENGWKIKGDLVNVKGCLTLMIYK